MAQKYGFVYLKFTFQPIAWKHLNSLTTIDTLRKLGSAEVTHPFSVREVLSSIPSSSKGLYVLFFVLLCYYFLSKTHCHKILQFFLMLIYLVNLTYCNICDQLLGYKDAALASLTIVPSDIKICLSILTA